MFVHIHKQNHSKLDPWLEKCVFVGYSTTYKWYKCYNPISKKLFVTMDVTFFENQPYFPKNHLQGGDVLRKKILFGKKWDPYLCHYQVTHKNPTKKCYPLFILCLVDQAL